MNPINTIHSVEYLLALVEAIKEEVLADLFLEDWPLCAEAIEQLTEREP